MRTHLPIWLAGLVLGGLTPAFAQPIITTQPQNQTVHLGDTATFTVEATGAEPLSYQWRRYTSPASFTDITGATTSSLVLENVESTFHRFRVVVTNPEGSVTSQLARLIVLLPPTITTQPANQVGEAGGSVTFSVSATGAGPIGYQWRFEEINLPGEIHSFLTLRKLRTELLGSYTVVLTNVNGSVTSQVATLSMFLTLQPPFDPGLNIDWDQDELRMIWRGEGILEGAESLAGPWDFITSISATNSSVAVHPLGSGTFYRVRNPHPRPVRLFVPSSYEPPIPLPFVILLHGYVSPAWWTENYMRLQPLAESRGFLYCYPDGTRESEGNFNPFWNATDAAANFYGSAVDDVAYLRSLILEVQRGFGADPKRVHLIGHSNGGAMCYRMACEHADLIAGIASLAGSTFKDPSNCAPSQPVNVLHIHGTGDIVAPYEGGFISGVPDVPPDNPPIAGAIENIDIWAVYNGCTDAVTESEPSMDLDLNVADLDTIVTRYTTCPPGGAVELWTMVGSGHVPTFFDVTNNIASEFSERVVDWLLAHPKP